MDEMPNVECWLLKCSGVKGSRDADLISTEGWSEKFGRMRAAPRFSTGCAMLDQGTNKSGVGCSCFIICGLAGLCNPHQPELTLTDRLNAENPGMLVQRPNRRKGQCWAEGKVGGGLWKPHGARLRGLANSWSQGCSRRENRK